MKLHIGCGAKRLPGWKHLDIRQVDEHIDYVASADKLTAFADGSVEEIYACHLLEHFGRWEADGVLREWHRVLAEGGTLWLAVPDFEAIAAEYAQNHDLRRLLGLLYGGQDDPYNYHHVTFDFADLSRRLEDCGFREVRRYDWREFLENSGGGWTTTTLAARIYPTWILRMAA